MVVRGLVRRVVRGVGSVGSPRSGGQFFQLSPYKHCNFARVYLLVKMASKTVTRSIASFKSGKNLFIVLKIRSYAKVTCFFVNCDENKKIFPCCFPLRLFSRSLLSVVQS